MSDEPQPGWVEVEFTDAAGERHRLQGKSIDFSDSWSRSHDAVPDGLDVECEVIGPAQDATVMISLDTLPWLDEGASFLVRVDQVRRFDNKSDAVQ